MPYASWDPNPDLKDQMTLKRVYGLYIIYWDYTKMWYMLEGGSRIHEGSMHEGYSKQTMTSWSLGSKLIVAGFEIDSVHSLECPGIPLLGYGGDSPDLWTGATVKISYG